MHDVLELKSTAAEGCSKEKDTWILRLPDDICRREGFAEGTMISLTIRNAGIKTELIPHNEEATEAAREFIEQYADFMREMERIGD